jgi:serine/threonine protein kinase
MTDEQWREAWVAFQSAENLPEEEAEELLEQSPMSAEVRDAVVEMLHSGGPATGSRASGLAHSNPATGPLPAPALSLAAGTKIDRYLLLEKIGEGGMGEVWLAGQKEPVQRQVALKLIKTGSGSRELMSRFESERQALALMDHPGIAKVFDAGSTAQGLPYFVMEYAAGEPITTYCDRRRLSTRERLELFIQVCEAVQHAHRKAIIHRDLKPSNIMVVEIEGRPAPKIIDFGIAKALNQKLSADTIHTGFGALVGTPEYMSPEQAVSGGADIDTRTDVYSLGVVFYELLAGARPIDLNQMGLEEFLRRLREENTPRPSTRVSTKDAAASSEVASRRQTEPPALARQLRGDLDAIALKALEKDRERRYESAGALARDIERYLAGEAVEAQPPSPSYRLRKFASRHRWVLGAAAALLALLIVAVVWMSVALRQQMRANANAAALRDVVRKVMIQRPAQLAQLPNSLKLRSDLMSDVEGALTALSGEIGRDRNADLELARAYYAIGNVRGGDVSDGSLGQFQTSINYFERSGKIAGGLIHAHPEDRDAQKMFLTSQMAILYNYRRFERFAEAERVARQIVAHAQALPSRMHREDSFVDYDISTAYKEIAAMKTSQGQLEESLALNRSALAAFSANMQAHWLKSPLVKNNLAACNADTGLSEWRLHGYSAEASALMHIGLTAVEGCPDKMCRSRSAELEGYAGLVDWSGGREKDGLRLMQRGVADFDTMLAADSADVVARTAVQSLRGSYALALIGSGHPGEALGVLRKFVKPDDLQADPRDLLIYGQALEADGQGIGSERYFQAASDRLNQEHADGFETQTMRWAIAHLLAGRADRLRNYQEAIGYRREEMRLAERLPADASTAGIFRSASAAAFARSVAAIPDAPAALRAEALRALAGCSESVPSPYRVEHAGMIVKTPTPQEVVNLQGALGN